MGRDETQDSNSTNLRMVELLASTHNNFMLVMDDEQSIYGFRGANLDAVLETLNNHEGLEVLNLEQNFRSTQTIVNASSAVIKRNTNQLAKNVFSKNKKGSPILAYDATDDAREGEFISEVISSLVSSGQYKYDDFMILYRTHWKSKAIEACLNQKGIPYSIVGGTEFYEREDVKNLVAYLRLIDNRFDDLALERVINVPKRGIGAKTVDRINVFASQAQIPMFSVLENIDDVPKINKPTQKRIGEFHDLIEAQHELSRDPDASIADMLYTILQETEYFHDFDNLRLAHQERVEIIERLCKIAEDFDKRDKHELEEDQSIISQFLTETSLYIEDNEDGEAAPRVQMLTSHASKGLEAPVVFIAGLEQGVFPSSRALTGEEREEERRLFYVSMTRAEEVLFLTHSEKSYGYGKTRKNRPSMFLSEIPEEYIHWLGQKHEEVPF